MSQVFAPDIPLRLIFVAFVIGWLIVFVLWLHFRKGESWLNAVGEASALYFAIMIPACIWSLA